MAQHADFPQANFTWASNAPDVDDLRAHIIVDEHGQITESFSCWTLTKEELFEIVHTGKVWLYVRGVHPPVLVMGQTPFKEDYDNDG